MIASGKSLTTSQTHILIDQVFYLSATRLVQVINGLGPPCRRHLLYCQSMDGCPCCLPRGQSIFALPEHELIVKAFVKIGLEIQARPWQLWPSDQQITYRVSAYLLTVMFWSLQIAHAEEVSLFTVEEMF